MTHMLVTLLSMTYITECVLVPREDRMVRIKLQFNGTLPRLDNFGLPVAVPAGHAGQNPQFGNMSIHWVELISSYLTAVGDGEVIYSGPQYETDAVDFNHTIIDHTQAIIAGADEYFLNISLKDIKPATYTYIRASVSYQEFKASFNLINNVDDWLSNTLPYWFPNTIKQSERGTAWIQSFTGVNTYIGTIYNQGFELVVNAEKLQGFWTAAETFDNQILNDDSYGFRQLRFGQLPPGTTTVPNPLWKSAATPPGSCVVVGQFLTPLVVPDAPLNNDDNEDDISLTLRISVNQSLEWQDLNGNGKWDLYFIVDENATLLTVDTMEILNSSEPITDMGTRGLWPIFEGLQREYVMVDTTTMEPADNANQFKIVGVVIMVIFSFL